MSCSIHPRLARAPAASRNSARSPAAVPASARPARARPALGLPAPGLPAIVLAAVTVSLLAACPAGALPVPAESLRTVVVTIDGIRKSEFVTWNERLLSWIDSTGVYLPLVVNATRGITEPNHAILWGSGDPGQCLNMEGHPAEPMHFELLRRQRGLPITATAVVTGKQHLADATIHSCHPDYGRPYRTTMICATSGGPACLGDQTLMQGPDSLVMQAALAHLAAHDVAWMGINLSEYDFICHDIGLVCCQGDTACYWRRAEDVYREAERLVLDELWPFLGTHPRYAGRTLLIVTTDHGRHDDGVLDGFTGHGHGWLPDSTGCAPTCPGCAEIWAMFAGPGIHIGYEAAGTYTLEDIASTTEFMMSFGNPFQTGVPIAEAMEEGIASGMPAARRRPTMHLEVEGPHPFAGRARLRCCFDAPARGRLSVHDVTGAMVYSRALAVAAPGCKTLVWDGTDRHSRPVRPGLYYVRLSSGGDARARSLAMLR